MTVNETRLRTAPPPSSVLEPLPPVHVGIMMDGNGRWAAQRSLPRLMGHRHGTENVRRVLTACRKHGIQMVTLYVFSTENWGRPAEEVKGFFKMLEQVIDVEIPKLHAEGVRLRHLGSLEGIPPLLARKVSQAVELTRHNDEHRLNVAFNYGGRVDILRAVRRLAASGLGADQVSEETLAAYLDTAGLPPIDLIIRTGGEMRLSNFFPWEGFEAEYWSTPVCWPDFDEHELRKALDAYAERWMRHAAEGD